MVRKMHFIPLFVLLALLLSQHGDAHGAHHRSHHKFPLMNHRFIDTFLKYVIKSGAFVEQQETDMADLMETLSTALETSKFQKNSAAKTQAMKYAFASVIADLVVRDDNSPNPVPIETKKKAIRWCLQKAYQEVVGEVDNIFVAEIETLINLFEKESNDDSYEEDYEDNSNVEIGVDAGVDLDLGVGLGVRAGVAVDAGLGLGVETGLGFGVDTDLGAEAGLGVDTAIDAGIGFGLGLGVGSELDAGLGLGIGVDINIITNFKLRLLSQLQATGILNRFNLNTISSSNILTLSRLANQFLASSFRLQLDYTDIKDLYSKLISININQGIYAYYNALTDFTAQYLVRNKLLSNIEIALSTSLQSILNAIVQAFNIDIDIGATLALAAKADANLGLGLDAGIRANVGTAVGVDSALGVDLGLDIAAGAGADIKTGVGVAARLGLEAGLAVDADVGVGAGLAVDLGLKFKLGLLSRIRAYGIFDRIRPRAFTRSQLVALARTTCGLLGGRLGLQLGASHVKSLFNLLVAVDFNSGFDGYYEALAGFVSQLLTSQGLLRYNIDGLFAPCLESIFLSISKTFNFDIDIAAALDIALAVDVNLDLGVAAGVGLDADLGLAAAADLGVGVGLGADVDAGVGVGVDVNANVGLGVEAELGLGIDAGLGLGVEVGAEVDIAAKFEIELLTRLKNSNILKNLGLKSFSKKQIFSFSKLIVGLLSKKFNVDIGNSIIKYLFKLFLSVDISGGFDGYYNIFAKFISRLLLKQNLLNNDFDKLYPTCLEVFFLAISQAFNINIDLAAALNVALGVDVGVELGIGAAVGVDAGVGVDVVTGVGVGAGVGVGVNTGVGVDIGSGIDIGAEVGVDVDAAVGVGAQVQVDVAIDLAARLGQLLVSSEEFNLALLSKNRESVLSVISSLIAESYGDEAGNAFASSCGI